MTLVLSMLVSAVVSKSFADTPDFFVGMQATYDFSGDVASTGETLYRITCVHNWTVLAFLDNVMKVDAQWTITQVEGALPALVVEAYNPFPNASRSESFEFDLSKSYWWYYLNDSDDQMMKYKVEETSFESQLGDVGCALLHVRNPRQEWYAFYDKATGLLINLQESFQVGDYTVTYTASIMDTNASLSPPITEPPNHTLLYMLAVAVAMAVAIGAVALRRHRKPHSNAES